MRKEKLFILNTLNEVDLNYLKRIAQDSSIKWNHLMPCGVAKVFCTAPLSILNQIWNKLDRGKPFLQVHHNLDCTLTEWRPSQFENEKNRSYESFCPTIMYKNTQPNDYGTTFKVLAYKSAKYSNNHNEKKRWYVFPSLNYLPKHVTKVLAGDGGLLVCCGGVQPCHLRDILNESLLPLIQDETNDFDTHVNSLGQDLIVITNPLTREYCFLPSIPCLISQEKIARIIVIPKEFHSLKKPQEGVISILAHGRLNDIPSGSQLFSLVPKEYFPPYTKPMLNEQDNFVPKSRKWQCNNSISTLQPSPIGEVGPNKEVSSETLGPSNVFFPSPKTQGSHDIVLDLKKKVGNVDNVMQARIDIHETSSMDTTNGFSINSMEIELDPYENRLEEFCHDYVVVVVGCSFQHKSHNKFNEERIVVSIYKSIEKEKGWWLRPLPFISQLMPSKHGQSGIGFWKKNSWMVVCFGGILVEQHFEEISIKPLHLVHIEDSTNSINHDCNINHVETKVPIQVNTTNCNEKLLHSPDSNPNKIKPPIGDLLLPKHSKIIPTSDECGNLTQKLWCEESSSESTTPSIIESSRSTPLPTLEQVLVETRYPVLYYVSIVEEDDFALALHFNPFGTKESHLQCPIVVQPFGWHSSSPNLYAITRSAILADTILIFGIGFEVGYKNHPIPSGSYCLLSKMPQSIFNNVFQTIDYSSKQFECCGGNGLICIRVIDINIVAIYNIGKDLWYLEECTNYLPTKANGSSFQMFENCVFEPSFWQKADVTNRDNNVNELLHHCTPEKYFGCHMPQ